MTNSILCATFILAAVTAVVPAQAADRTAGDKSAGSACESRIRQLEASPAQGQERLNEKNAVIEYCADQYETDQMIQTLVDECAKYEEQPVVIQQFVAECQLAAFNYANTLYALKAEAGK
jgi:hypothetical protein